MVGNATESIYFKSHMWSPNIECWRAVFRKLVYLRLLGKERVSFAICPQSLETASAKNSVHAVCVFESHASLHLCEGQIAVCLQFPEGLSRKGFFFPSKCCWLRGGQKYFNAICFMAKHADSLHFKILCPLLSGAMLACLSV